MNNLQKLVVVVTLGVALLGFASRSDSSGVASYDLKKDVVTNTITGVSGVQTFSVTCPDGGVALSKGVENPDIYGDPLYYHMSESLSESGHVVTANLGADWTDESEFDARLTVTCVSLAG
jgi:hypothetical protein